MVNATCRKCPHKVHRMEMKTAISCTILRHTKILIAVGVCLSMVQLMAVFISKIGRAVQQECRDRPRMPSSFVMRDAQCDVLHPKLLCYLFCLAGELSCRSPTRRSSDLRKCPHKVHRMEMKTAISCTILRHTKILIAVGVCLSMVQLMAVFIS